MLAVVGRRGAVRRCLGGGCCAGGRGGAATSVLLGRSYGGTEGAGSGSAMAPYATATRAAALTPTPSARKPHPSHVPTTALQRGVLAGVSAVTALLDPRRDDMVAALGETTGLAALEQLRVQMQSHPVGREMLRDRPAITSESLDMDRLRKLPEGTFGREYVTWMDENGYSPDGRPPVRYIEDSELAFIMQRYRQTHDFTHVLLGPIPPTVLGEILVKWFELAHFNLPMNFLSAVVGPAALSRREMSLLYQTRALSWVSKVGQSAELLLNVRFEDRMDWTMKELRLDLGLPPDGPPEEVMEAIS